MTCPTRELPSNTRINVEKTRPELPVELYTHTLGYLGTPKDPLALKTLLSVRATSTYLLGAASYPLLWKPFYEKRFTRSVPENEARRRAQYGDDYYKLFFARCALDHRALQLVDGIRREIPRRSERACVLARELSFDVWDALEAETKLPLPKYFRKGKLRGAPEAAPEAFPRRYWAREAQGVIARYWAVSVWKRVASGEAEADLGEMSSGISGGPPGVAFEDVFAGFSAFFGWAPFQIKDELDTISKECREFLERVHCVWDQTSDKFDLVKACSGVIKYMKMVKFIADDMKQCDYLLDSYPHMILLRKIEFPLSTLSKTWIFIAICQRLGLVAYPTQNSGITGANNLPVTICCVLSLVSEQSPIVVNFARAPTPIRVTELPAYRTTVDTFASLTTVPPQVKQAFIVVPPLTWDTFLDEAVTEASENITLYEEHENDDRCCVAEEERGLTAMHALQCAWAILQEGEPAYGGKLPELFPLDGEAIVLDLLADANPGADREARVKEVRKNIRRAEDVDGLVMRRSRFPGRPDLGHYHVGKVITDDSFGQDIGCLLDWKIKTDDPHVAPGTEVFWEREYYPRRLEESRNPEPVPPKYRPKYMAGLTRDNAYALHRRWKRFGRYVEDVSFSEVDSEGCPKRLVMTAEMRTLYPEDGIPEPAPYQLS